MFLKNIFPNSTLSLHYNHTNLFMSARCTFLPLHPKYTRVWKMRRWIWEHEIERVLSKPCLFLSGWRPGGISSGWKGRFWWLSSRPLEGQMGLWNMEALLLEGQHSFALGTFPTCPQSTPQGTGGETSGHLEGRSEDWPSYPVGGWWRVGRAGARLLLPQQENTGSHSGLMGIHCRVGSGGGSL